MLKPVLTMLSIAKNAVSVVLKDITGPYDSVANTGGYGPPNAAFSGNWGLLVRKWYQEEVYANKVYINKTAIIGTNGFSLPSTDLGPAAFASGVHHFTYYPLENTTALASLTQGSKQVLVQGTPLNSLFVSTSYKAVVFMFGGSPSKIFLIDHSQPFTTSQFYLKSEWTEISSTTSVIWFATEADLKILFTELAEQCLAQQIAKLPLKLCCDHKEVNELTTLLMYRFAADARYASLDYCGADSMIRTVGASCECVICDHCE